jgi:very-short-patch-repair endonuclease
VVDATLLPERIITEADGRQWHTRERDFRRDRERDRLAALAGYVTVRFTFAEMQDRDSVVSELTDLRIRRRQDLSLPPLPRAA